MNMQSEYSDTTTTRSTKSWIQWLLIYPSFAIAIIGAVPQYIDVIYSINKGVETSEVDYVRQQHSLFVRNINCHPALETVKTVINTKVSVGACPSGDIQVNIEYANSDIPVIRWIAFEKLNSNQVSNWLSIIPSAMAQENLRLPIVAAAANIQVFCQQILDNGKILRSVRIAGTCYEQTINTYTGKIEKQKQIPCDSKCR